MKRLLLPLLAALALPSSVNSSIESKPIPQISDFKVNVELPLRLNIFCPKNYMEQDDCWVEFKIPLASYVEHFGIIVGSLL